MSALRLIQIPFSHNCVKVRVALELKGLRYEIEDIPPASRGAVLAASGQGLVPVLIDDGKPILDSTAILLHLEERYPDPPLLPREPARATECLVFEDWADRAFMELARRVSYVNVLARPGALATLFFPDETGPRAWIKERLARRIVRRRFGLSERRHVRDLADAKRAAALALRRLDGNRWLFGAQPTVADVGLATMSAPLAADRGLRENGAVSALLAWGEALVPEATRAVYRG